MAEEEVSITDKLEDAYRLRFPAQLMIYLIFLLAVAFVLYLYTIYAWTHPMRGEITVLAFLFALTLPFPIIVKERNAFTYATANGFFFALLLPVIAFILLHLGEDELTRPTLGLLVASVEIFAVETYHHMSPLQLRRDPTGYMISIILAIIFFVSIFIFLIEFGAGLAVFLALLLTLLFLFAILPEMPI
jgi:hypothetical protein